MEPTAHSSVLRQFARFADENGIMLSEVLDADLRDTVAQSGVTDRIPARAVVDILQHAAEGLKRPDFGVAFADWVNIRGFGPLSLLPDHFSSVAEAMSFTIRFLHVENAALAVTVEGHADEVAVRYLLMVPTQRGGSQFIESILMLAVRTMRLILGEDWSPLRVEFDHAPPPDTRGHRQRFRCPLAFGEDRAAVVLARRDMNRSARSGNPDMLAYLRKQLAKIDQAWPAGIEAQVERVIASNLTNGGAHLDHVARVLSTSARTLQRRLSDHGSSFADILQRVRRRRAEEYFTLESRPSLNDLAFRLGYGDASAASRFLRASLGTGMRRRLTGSE